MFRWHLRCALALFAGAVVAWGQVNTATIYGNVADPSGAAVPHARATLQNVSTGLSQTVVSNGAGEFTFTFIPVGTYDLTVTATGFETYSQRGLTLAAGQNLRLQIALQVGSVQSTVTVTGEQPLVNAVNAQQQTTLKTETSPNCRRHGSTGRNF